jgi:hypothetical protein
MSIVQVPVPLHAALPLHPVKVPPLVAVAVSVTDVPLAKFAEHVLGHEIPDGLLVTVPVPVPASFTVNANDVVVLNVAVTDSAAIIEIEHVPVPLQAAFPLHPANVEPVPAVAVKVTTELSAKLAEQAVPQLMPAGLLVTVPVPVPAFVTVNGNTGVNDAFALSFAFIVTTHVPVPLHPAPLQPTNVLPLFGVAVSVTTVPLLKLALQPVPPPVGQLMPAGLLVTVPLPVPASVTVNANVVVALNVAVTLSAAVMSIVHVPVPLHAAFPLHPANVDPVPAVAVSTTCDPLAKFAVHVGGQLIPAGLLVTVPVPVPDGLTVTVYCVAAAVATARQCTVPEYTSFSVVTVAANFVPALIAIAASDDVTSSSSSLHAAA